jgi:hypothetical protein
VATERSCISIQQAGCHLSSAGLRWKKEVASADAARWLPSGDSNSFQTVLANLSGNLEVKLLDCVPFLNQVDIFLARKLVVQHLPHLHASLNVKH